MNSEKMTDVFNLALPHQDAVVKSLADEQQKSYLPDILRIFIMDLEYIAIPAVVTGLVAAWFTADKWMQNFASKIPLHWEIYPVPRFYLSLCCLDSCCNLCPDCHPEPGGSVAV